MQVLKLDLHTHCGEASMRSAPHIKSVRAIIAAARARRLDGIAITDHHNKPWGLKAREIAREHFEGRLIIICGQEINRSHAHLVELYLTESVTFRFICHPGYPRVEGFDFATVIDGSIHGIELRNPPHQHEMNESAIREAADKHHLLLLENSDAHTLRDIGRHYNRIAIETLIDRAGCPDR